MVTPSCGPAPVPRSGPRGPAEPAGRVDDGRADTAVSLRFALQTGRQRDLPALIATEGQHQLQGCESLLPQWVRQTQRLCGPVCSHGRGRRSGPGCCGLVLRAEERHQPGWQRSPAGGSRPQNDSEHAGGCDGCHLRQVIDPMDEADGWSIPAWLAKSS